MKIKILILFLMAIFGGFLVLIYQKLTEKETPISETQNGVFTASSLGVSLSLAQQVDALKLEIANKSNHSFFSGNSLPTDEIGSNGDTYLHITTGNVYQKSNNTWF